MLNIQQFNNLRLTETEYKLKLENQSLCSEDQELFLLIPARSNSGTSNTDAQCWAFRPTADLILCTYTPFGVVVCLL